MASESIGSMPGIEISNSVVAIVGTVALFGIGAHLLGQWLAPRQKKEHAVHVAADTASPTIYEAMYAETVASASHPETVHQNADRVHAAIKQREPRIKQLASRVQNGEIGPEEMAQGIHANVQDVLEQLEIPCSPHPSSAHPALIELFKAQRQHALARRFHVPGGLVLDDHERRWLDHQAMTYVGETDPLRRTILEDQQRRLAEQRRLAMLRQAAAERQLVIHNVDSAVDRQETRAPSYDVQGDRLERLGIA